MVTCLTLGGWGRSEDGGGSGVLALGPYWVPESAAYTPGPKKAVVAIAATLLTACSQRTRHSNRTRPDGKVPLEEVGRHPGQRDS